MIEVGTVLDEKVFYIDRALLKAARFIKPVIVPAGEKVDLTVTATVAEIADGKISLSLSATSAGVKVLGMAKAVVIK
ncbi:MAG: hypothetical protein NT101_06670 [Actinobacteria bacterium]|nr:hypothetical protein [Actinomycetota bacterium]